MIGAVGKENIFVMFYDQIDKYDILWNFLNIDYIPVEKTLERYNQTDLTFKSEKEILRDTDC